MAHAVSSAAGRGRVVELSGNFHAIKRSFAYCSPLKFLFSPTFQWNITVADDIYQNLLIFWREYTLTTCLLDEEESREGDTPPHCFYGRGTSAESIGTDCGQFERLTPAF